MLCEKVKPQNSCNDQSLNKIINHKKTLSRLEIQLGIVRKIIQSIVWLNKQKFDRQLLYEISKFLFRNPLSFIAPIYKKVCANKLKIEQKKSYILINAQLHRNPDTIKQKEFYICNNNRQSIKLYTKSSDISQKSFNMKQKCSNFQSIKSGQYSIHIKVNRCWKNCKINYHNSSFKQIILKSKHFLDFLKNVKIDNPKFLSPNYQRLETNENFDQKQNKLYTLICQNYDYILSKILQIQENQKHKRLDDCIAKTYVQMMNKNIVILTIEKNNFNSISYKSQGKFIYVSNSLKMPLFSQKFQRIYSHLQAFKVQKSLIDLIPYLQANHQGLWHIKNKIPGSLLLFEQRGKKIDRQKGVITDKFLNFFQYDDFSLRHI